MAGKRSHVTQAKISTSNSAPKGGRCHKVWRRTPRVCGRTELSIILSRRDPSARQADKNLDFRKALRGRKKGAGRRIGVSPLAFWKMDYSTLRASIVGAWMVNCPGSLLPPNRVAPC